MNKILYITGKGHTVTLKEKYKLNDILYLNNEEYKVVGIESYGDLLYKTYIIKKVKEELNPNEDLEERRFKILSELSKRATNEFERSLAVIKCEPTWFRNGKQFLLFETSPHHLHVIESEYKKLKEENESLKKPREVMPKQSEEQYDRYCCPNCNIYTSEDIRPNYCWHCGIKFSWDSIAKKENIRSIRKIKGIWESKKDNE